MSAKILDGKKAAAKVLENVRQKAAELARRGVTPGLATVLVGDDPASAVYVRQKIKACEAHGLKSVHVPLPADVSEVALLEKIRELNRSPEVHGIIVQLPLPKHIHADRALLAVDPRKDVDGLHPVNQGQWMRLKSWKEILASGRPLPCTPAGVMELLEQNGVRVAGRRATVIGRSTLVGKPLALMLLSADATVTLCHSRTTNIAAVCREADILIAAIGSPRFVKSSMVKRGAVVVDVGSNRTEKGTTGDVDFERVRPLAKAITPVPGGVGPMTVAMLLWNTVRSAEQA
ncbi:MAG TPA: bifunctional methylenetetrahydrofolate dehydrogenase/methenyltetrahydrofolate cyclohydrolase FolD [Elusimicrobiota bacterium]|nr:bifunctional methylenetetrahydrofolate dehydrogenase/methenyltetrahydrofolate cyclohydrolase FolD [Elusimicrobiota bacterium]